MPENTSAPARLRKELGLADVYAISTGAMFSSGFFLLPGIAAAETGPSVVVAYLIAGVFILPAMLSVAELSTAMPRAGGAYYFLDRALGPLVGTVGGVGAWFGLVLKSAFALVGMGAYLALVVDVPIKPVALACTFAFALVNLVGAKESSGLQRILVGTLVAILTAFVTLGLFQVAMAAPSWSFSADGPFLEAGLSGLMATVGLVFVSYAGLTKVASVAEEIRRPERNIPLGMGLSLATATVIYVGGVYVLVKMVDGGALARDLTPVASASGNVFGFLPGPMGLVLVVVAAIAAFASTGNAGILSASRYPLAMARDGLVSARLARLGRFGTPQSAILLTSAAIAAAILFLDVSALAKLASAFTLLLFALLNLAVLVMRESEIEAYDPGFRSPLYPWVQLFGIISAIWLVSEMGSLAILFSLALVGASVAWYWVYGRGRITRNGAIFHAFERLGRQRFTGLDRELAALVREQALRADDLFDDMVVRAPFLDSWAPGRVQDVFGVAAYSLAHRAGIDGDRLASTLVGQAEAGLVPVAHGVALPHARIKGLTRPNLAIVRCRNGLARGRPAPTADPQFQDVRALLILVSPEENPGQHLRLLGHLATLAQDDGFLERWLGADDGQQIKETMLGEGRTLVLSVGDSPGSAAMAGVTAGAAGLPAGVRLAMIRRGLRGLSPGPDTVLEAGDRLTFVGSPSAIRALGVRYGRRGSDAAVAVR